MPSTRKQRAKETRFRQSDVMSDLENMDAMLGPYPRIAFKSNFSERNMQIDLESNGPRQEVKSVSEDFRSLLNTNSSENSEVTAETARMINGDFTNQIARKLGEIKMDSNLQIQEAINSAVAEAPSGMFRQCISVSI